ncbi:MAG: pirin family protein [Flavobacteriales bacterium]|nr:pirin family protein [Flavobacteriales bacterium]
MKKAVHKANTRGHSNHGWLDSHHSFSFANYFNPERVYFGMLRVLNDDIVTGGNGFGTHPHENMEIISIPLEGDLEHKDSMGTAGVIRKNDVQIMSAGTGVFHSEYNKNPDQVVNFLQLWIFPKYKDIAPRYDQKTFDPACRKNQFQEIVSPIESSGSGVKINQDAYLHMAEIAEGNILDYHIKCEGNGVYAFVLNGSLELEGEQLEERDAIGVYETETLKFKAIKNAEVLLIEVPMN